MKIEVGKYYRTRDGRKVGPMVQWTIDANHPFEVTNEDGTDLGRSLWSESGRNDECSDLDLIAEWTEDETGTLAELDVRPGDVVELVRGITNMYEGHTYTIQQDGKVLDNNGSGQYYGFADDFVDDVTFRIISRASGTTKAWGEMTDAEKGELLLAHHEGKTIEFNNGSDEWVTLSWDFDWLDEHAYRIKPEPVRETVTLYAGHVDPDCDPMPIGTIDLEDGKPDLDSIKMEEV